MKHFKHATPGISWVVRWLGTKTSNTEVGLISGLELGSGMQYRVARNKYTMQLVKNYKTETVKWEKKAKCRR